MAVNKDGSSDPWVRLRIDNQKEETDLVKNTVNPTFNQVKKFEVNYKNRKFMPNLKVECWSGSSWKGSYDFLGDHEIDITGILEKPD